MVNIVTDDINILQDNNKSLYKMAVNIYQQLGPGHSEYIYHRAMEVELRTHCINYETEKRVLILYKDKNNHTHTLGEERIDLFLQDTNTIIELKALITAPKETEIAQVHKYYRELKKVNVLSEYGIVINFPQAGAKSAKDNIDFYEIKL